MEHKEINHADKIFVWACRLFPIPKGYDIYRTKMLDRYSTPTGSNMIHESFHL